MGSEPEHVTAREDPEPGVGEEVKEGAKTVGRGILWLVIIIAVLAVVVGVFLLGPLGLGIVVPAVLAIWIAAAAASGGPAIGA
ncbi:MAG TPA: hypothetical protein VFQ71_11115 [Gaiellales bacterium]|jgi:hypothetical protein|nr:hypothetical protein [Gaiellales bacterium]